MPRDKKSTQELLQTWIDSDSKLFADVRYKENDLFCNVCERVITSSKKSNVSRHLKSHASSNDDTIFFYDLTLAFVASGIPIHKLKNPTLLQFLEKYINRKIPNSATLRKRYVDQIYQDVLQNIRNDIRENFVYFVIDEAIDRSGRSVVNFLIGALKPNSASGSHLVASKLLDITNEKTVIEFVTECFHCLWPNQNNSKKVLLMLTGEAAYMRKAGDMLTKTLPNMIHFTCAAHGLNQIAETIRNSFPLVNDLIENVHKIFVKAPTRIDMFREALPHVPLPPEPVVTRWDTWLEAVAYYDKHFAELKCVIFRFDPNESNAMHTVLNLLQLQSIRDEVRYINSNYSILITAIKKLGTYGLSLQEQFMVLDAVKQKINSYNSHDASTVIKKKLQDVFMKNPGYSRLEHMCSFLKGTHQELSPSLLKYRPYIYNFSYCPLVTIDIERTFSLRKLLLNDKKRQSLTAENLEKFLVIQSHYQHRSGTRCKSETVTD